MPVPENTQRRWESKRAKKAQLHAAVLRGLTIKEALEEQGTHSNTYQRWRQDDKEYAAQIDHARAISRTGPGHGHGIPRYTEHVPPDFQGFVAKYFPDRQPHQTQQIMLVNALQDLKPSEVCLFLIFPEAGKTSTLEDYICRKLALDPSHRFRVVSQSQDHSKNIAGMVKRRMTDTSQWGEYITQFGPFYEQRQERSGRPWGADELTVARSPGTERDKSLVASSWSSATTGSRIDTLILDDVQTPENYNEAEKIFKRIRSAFFTRSLNMRTLIIGHRVGAGDFYDRLREERLITKEIILYATGDLGAEAGMPSVPEFWTAIPKVHDNGPCCGGLDPFRTCPNDGSQLTALEAMELKRHQVGEDAWWSMYMQEPSSDAMTSFGAYVDSCLDHDRAAGPLVGV